jgi:hypothetical protein
MMAVATLATVFAGFAPTFYLRPPDAPALPMLTQVHGLVFTAWVLVVLTQVWLVAAKRRTLHKRLGVAGGTLAVAMIVLGVTVALAQARREVAAGHADEARSFLLIPLGGMVSFATLVATGLAYRARTEIHRRLMLLATIAILPAAIGRIPGFQSPAAITAYFFALLAAAPVHDLLMRRRPHPVSLWGGLAVFVYELGRFLFSKTEMWRAIAERIV